MLSHLSTWFHHQPVDHCTCKCESQSCSYRWRSHGNRGSRIRTRRYLGTRMEIMINTSVPAIWNVGVFRLPSWNSHHRRRRIDNRNDVKKFSKLGEHGTLLVRVAPHLAIINLLIFFSTFFFLLLSKIRLSYNLCIYFFSLILYIFPCYC